MFLRPALLAASLVVCGVCAAEVPCGIQSVSETTAPVYPPIARAAHVSGTVLLLATFDTSGNVMELRTVSGPMLLRGSAEVFVKGWKANPYTGPRSCPVVVKFALANESFCSDDDAKKVYVEPSHRLDVQHYLVSGYAYALCDPAAEIGYKRRRLGIF